MPSQWKEYANQNTKYAISIRRLRQLKHQIRHLNQKSTPTKTPSTPSQSKEYAKVNFSPQYWFMLFWREAIIVVNLRTFWRTILSSENCAGVQKMTNYRYELRVNLNNLLQHGIMYWEWKTNKQDPFQECFAQSLWWADQRMLGPEIIRNIDGAAISHLIPHLNTVSWQASPQQVIEFYYSQIFTGVQ